MSLEVAPAGRLPNLRRRRRAGDASAAAKTLLGGLAVFGVVAGCVAFALAASERPSFLSPRPSTAIHAG
jgi:hypothetical protein